MLTMSISVPHNLEVMEAKNKIKTLLDELQVHYHDKISDPRILWNNNIAEFSFRMMSLPISGELNVDPREVCLSGTLPFLAIPFKSMIEEAIREKARELLGIAPKAAASPSPPETGNPAE